MVVSAVIGFLFEAIPALYPFLSGGTIPAFIVSAATVLLGAIVGKKNPPAPEAAAFAVSEAARD